MRTTTCSCGWKFYNNGKTIQTTCPQCQNTITVEGHYDRIEEIKERANTQKRLVSWLTLFKQPHEQGVGDTTKRFYSSSNTKEIHQLLKHLLSSCNCKLNDAVNYLNQQYPYPNAIGYINVPSDLNLLPVTKRKHLIITVATGEVHEQLLHECTAPCMQRYADKFDADFIALTGATQCWWGLEKMRIKPLIEQYDRALFLDADVLIREGAPNLFDVVPPGHIGMHDDYIHCKAKNGLGWLEPARRAMLDSQMVDYYEYPGALNTGVVVTDREHASIWTPWKNMDFPRSHVDEQLWVEWLAWKHPIFGIPTEFNTQWWFRDFFERAKYAWFIHLANCPAERRIEMVKRFTKYGNIREVDRA